MATAGRHWGPIGLILLVVGSAAAAIWWWEAVSRPAQRALRLWPVVVFILLAGIGLSIVLAPILGLLVPPDRDNDTPAEEPEQVSIHRRRQSRAPANTLAERFVVPVRREFLDRLLIIVCAEQGLAWLRISLTTTSAATPRRELAGPAAVELLADPVEDSDLKRRRRTAVRGGLVYEYRSSRELPGWIFGTDTV
jgi:hypothetical protein